MVVMCLVFVDLVVLIISISFMIVLFIGVEKVWMINMFFLCSDFL